jgi:hypothetical protein
MVCNEDCIFPIRQWPAAQIDGSEAKPERGRGHKDTARTSTTKRLTGLGRACAHGTRDAHCGLEAEAAAVLSRAGSPLRRRHSRRRQRGAAAVGVPHGCPSLPPRPLG